MLLDKVLHVDDGSNYSIDLGELARTRSPAVSDARVVYSFDELCAPLWEEMLNYTKRLCNGNHELAQDVVQDAYLKALKAWRHWEPGGEDVAMYARAWMFRVVTSIYINQYNRRIMYIKHFMDRDDDVAAGTHALPQDMFTTLTANEFSDDVGTAVSSLPTHYRTVVEMIFVRGMERVEIAAELGVPVGTIDSRLHRALDSISKAVAHLAPSLGRKQLDGPRRRRTT